MIEASRPGGEPLPFGADVFDAAGANVGLVGQQSRIYARGLEDRGRLTVKWGKLPTQQCDIAYDMPTKPEKQALSAPILKLSGVCAPSGAAAPPARGNVTPPKKEDQS